MEKIAFIGAGAMAEAIISGIVSKQIIRPEQIFITNRSNDARLHYLHEQYGVTATRSLPDLLDRATAAVLAVKPKDIPATMEAVKPLMTEEMLIISVAAGVKADSLSEIVTKEAPIIRAMPNTSAAVGKSATALARNAYVTEAQFRIARSLFETFGTAAEVEEKQLDAVTGLSGSGPAYIYYLAEAMEQSAGELGLNRAAAKELMIQTLIGAAEMLKESGKSPALLRQEVTSPGGTTAAGLRVLEAYHVQEAFIKCIKEAAARSAEMGDQISEELSNPSRL
ncbi:pyrroline-5-carboxylate reductase [Bacillus massiliglaciei]|uniref:pyrroline-5-carboxylate reductase n=1 Tax=Bacillus massiliglaciei TaxID=1816693 RepID=UPI000AAA0401|nr:pyrroline-5-carboxylate reductase [Bacillus massiliglaciei]